MVEKRHEVSAGTETSDDLVPGFADRRWANRLTTSPTTRRYHNASV